MDDNAREEIIKLSRATNPQVALLAAGCILLEQIRDVLSDIDHTLEALEMSARK